MPKPRRKTKEREESLGERIRRFRVAKGLTQTELGKSIGASQRVIAYYEGKGVSPPPELVVKIADVLDISIDALFGRKKGEPDDEGLPPLRRLRRLKRLDELPRDDRVAVLKIIEALADRSTRRKKS